MVDNNREAGGPRRQRNLSVWRHRGCLGAIGSTEDSKEVEEAGPLGLEKKQGYGDLMSGAEVSVLGHPATDEPQGWHELWTLVKGPRGRMF